MDAVKFKQAMRASWCTLLLVLVPFPGYAEGGTGTEVDTSKAAMLYKAVCVACHGTDLSGGVGPSLIDPFWKTGDHAEAIYNTITKGIAGTEMIAFEAIYSEEDRRALAEYILSKQEGMRSLVRSSYARDHFKGKRFTPDLFKTVESTSQARLRENLIFFRNRFDGVSRLSSKLYIAEDGDYRFKVNDIGRTSIFLDGREVYYRDAAVPKDEYYEEALSLKAGVYDLEIFHEEAMAHQLKFHAELVKHGKGALSLIGRSLGGSEPKVIQAGGMAKVLRKKIAGISPRTLLCLLPNQVVVAFNPYTGQVEKVWQEARVDQTPSLPDRSFHPSVVLGNDRPAGLEEIVSTYPLRYNGYRVNGAVVEISTESGGVPYLVKIAPEGATGYSLEGVAEEPVAGFALKLTEAVKPHSTSDEAGNFRIIQK